MTYEIIQWDKYSFFKIKNDQTTVGIYDSMLDELNKIDLKGKNVIDGGCSIGVLSIFFADKVGKDGIVFSFDVQPILCDLIKKNAELNGKTNIEVTNAALSDKTGESVGFTFIDYGGDYISSGGIKTESSLSGQPHCGEIKTIAIDDLDIQNVGLIKLDIEGSEPKALKGMWNTIDKGKPYLLIELSNGYLYGGQDQEIRREIESHGYKSKDLESYNYFFEPI